MEIWFILVVTISITLLFSAFFSLFSPKKPYQTLPPGPFHIPIISDILWLKTTLSEIEPYLRSLHRKLGPIITLNFLSRPSIFISDRSIAHEALIQNGALFADRPQRPITYKIIGYHINSASYGPKWRHLRRNLTAEILHPLRVKSYCHARQWVLRILLDSLTPNSESGQPVRVLDNFQYAMFCLLVLMCVGDKLDQEQIREIEKVQRHMMLALGERFNVLNIWPKLTRLLLRQRWKEFYQIVDDQEKVMIRLIRARKTEKEERLRKSEAEKEKDYVLAYVDTLLDLQLPEEGNRKLTEEEIASLCSEFLNAGTDTTSTALQWIMANMVKYPHIQEKLFMEIKGVVAQGEKEVKEEDIQKIPYLKAVILEGLRRHPPGHFVLPHTVREDTVLGGFLLPKNVTIHFLVADMAWDPTVWDDPMAFKPERFLTGDNGEEFDMNGSREIKMMPFGVGRRICPGINLAMLHLEYFVANLIWNFEWKAVDGNDVSLEEKQEFTVVMKTPLQAHIYPRES